MIYSFYFYYLGFVFFFFKQKTAYEMRISDWSSDVCSSDLIAGLEEISAGIIRIGERAVNDVPPKDRDIAMVFQNYALYPHMTVRENMAFSLRLRRADRSLIDGQVQRAAEILGLGPLLDRYPKQLSGGQRQRVAMGRAIVRNQIGRAHV